MENVVIDCFMHRMMNIKKSTREQSYPKAVELAASRLTTPPLRLLRKQAWTTAMPLKQTRRMSSKMLSRSLHHPN
jgi:hypothetical protein